MIDKTKYNNTEIPDSLNSIVQNSIKEGLSKNIYNSRYRMLKRIISAAAVLIICFTILLNVSPVFAAALYKIPVLGSICHIITFQEYQIKDDTKYVDAKIPQIDNTGKSELEQRVNLEIQKRTNELLEENSNRAKEYYDAFIATGGDEKDYIPVDITIDYDIKCITKDYVSFVLFQHETKFSAYNYNYYYNIDMETGRALTLHDLLGDDYKQIAAASIRQTIDGWDEYKKSLLWDDLNFEDLITENSGFYINENKQVVIVFEKYEIAVGAAGSLEFTITPAVS